MDTLSIYYFIELTKKLHITETAESLHISQQTLSNHIHRLESYYDVVLFERRPKLTLTYTGEIFLKYALNLIQEEQNLVDSLADIKQNNFGKIKFGAGLTRGLVCLPEIINTFHHRFPNVEIEFCDSLSKELEKNVESGEIDYAIVVDNDSTLLQEHNSFHDLIYLCVPEKLLQEHYGTDSFHIKASAQSGANVKHFKHLPFALYTNRLGNQIKECFKDEHCSPKIYFSTTSSQVQLELCMKNLCACFITQMNLSNVPKEFFDSINVFPLNKKGRPFYVKVSIVRHPRKVITSHSQYFLSLLNDYFENLKKINFTNIVEP